MAKDGEGERRFFPARARVKRQQDFDAVYARGKRLTSASMVLIALQNQLGHNRLGLSVSRKVGGAVRRNLIKRRLREVFRCRQASWPKGYDLVVIPRAAFPETLAAIEAQLDALVGRLAVSPPEKEPPPP